MVLMEVITGWRAAGMGGRGRPKSVIASLLDFLRDLVEAACEKARRCCLTSQLWTVGWEEIIIVQPATRRIKRHGRRPAVTNKARARKVRYRKMVDERISSEKLVAGAMKLTRAS